MIEELCRRRVIRVAVVYGMTAYVVLQLAEVLADPFGLGSWAIRLVMFLLTLGFPLAVGLALVYNLTEEWGDGMVTTLSFNLDVAAPSGDPGPAHLCGRPADRLRRPDAA